MRHLFSTRLRVILIIAMVLSIGLTIVSGAVNQSIPSLLVQGLLAPLRYGANALTEQAERLYGYMFHYESLEAENEALKAACAGLNLAEICIVSSCDFEAVAEGATTGTGTNFSDLTIGVTEARGVKCPRCWMHSEAAGVDGLCPRCAGVISRLEIEL